MTEFESDVRAWDTRSAAAIGELFDRYSPSSEFAGEVVAMIADETTQRGATWLLKRHVETSQEPLDDRQTVQMFGAIESLEHWESKLHILQCMPRVAVPIESHNMVASFLRECISSDKKFVRAWAYSGLHELAVQYDQYQDEVMATLIDALENEKAGSVRVRLRKAIARGF